MYIQMCVRCRIHDTVCTWENTQANLFYQRGCLSAPRSVCTRVAMWLPGTRLDVDPEASTDRHNEVVFTRSSVVPRPTSEERQKRRITEAKTAQQGTPHTRPKLALDHSSNAEYRIWKAEGRNPSCFWFSGYSTMCMFFVAIGFLCTPPLMYHRNHVFQLCCGHHWWNMLRRTPVQRCLPMLDVNPPCKRDPEVIEIRQGLLLQYVVVRELCGVCKSVKSV